MIGLGDKHCNLAVYIGNRPHLDEYKTLGSLKPAGDGELIRIGRETGNHWRKIINIYAKLGFALDPGDYMTWQSYRDSFLLSKYSRQALLFDDDIVTERENCISIICGKTHAMKILNDHDLTWLDKDFAMDAAKSIIVTPYFDYRQLSNVKLEKLVNLIHKHKTNRVPN